MMGFYDTESSFINFNYVIFKNRGVCITHNFHHKHDKMIVLIPRSFRLMSNLLRFFSETNLGSLVLEIVLGLYMQF